MQSRITCMFVAAMVTGATGLRAADAVPQNVDAIIQKEISKSVDLENRERSKP